MLSLITDLFVYFQLNKRETKSFKDYPRSWYHAPIIEKQSIDRFHYLMIDDIRLIINQISIFCESVKYILHNDHIMIRLSARGEKFCT